MVQPRTHTGVDIDLTALALRDLLHEEVPEPVLSEAITHAAYAEDRAVKVGGVVLATLGESFAARIRGA